MPKLSDVFLRMLGGTLEGISGLTPEKKAEIALSQQNADTSRLSAFSNFNKDNEFTPRPAAMSDQFVPPEGSQEMNVPGMGQGYVRPRPQFDVVPKYQGDKFVGYEHIERPRGGKTVPYKPLAPKTSPEDVATAKLKAKIALEKPKAYGSLQNTLREYDNMIKEAQAIKSDPSIGTATGLTSFMGSVPGTGAKRVSARLGTLKAKTLLNVLSSLKQLSSNGASGFGALSESEGNAIRDSISTLDPKQKTEDLQASIDRFVTEMEARKSNLQGTFKSTYGDGDFSQQLLGQNSGNSSPALGTTIRVKNKKTGQTGSMPAASFDPNTYDQL